MVVVVVVVVTNVGGERCSTSLPIGEICIYMWMKYDDLIRVN